MIYFIVLAIILVIMVNLVNQKKNKSDNHAGKIHIYEEKNVKPEETIDKKKVFPQPEPRKVDGKLKLYQEETTDCIVVNLYQYKDTESQWICPNCKTENKDTNDQCSVCRCSR